MSENRYAATCTKCIYMLLLFMTNKSGYNLSPNHLRLYYCFLNLWSEGCTVLIFVCVNWGFTVTEGLGFQHLPRDLANVNALKNNVQSILLHKNWKHLLHFALFLALFLFRLFTDVSRKQFARTMLVLGPSLTHLVTAANLWPRYEHIESCVAVH